ncbi:unnamed protein product [Nesidiocoris tenuis]|uniref:Uncharacterized protein n=1 Tax=Nesidiocoris tenuis TaxID=355587 RepID=A0A6H5HQS9_9HEMI|nr:unnamed protein product [Nesidiocoris tenuis]
MSGMKMRFSPPCIRFSRPFSPPALRAAIKCRGRIFVDKCGGVEFRPGIYSTAGGPPVVPADTPVAADRSVHRTVRNSAAPAGLAPGRAALGRSETRSPRPLTAQTAGRRNFDSPIFRASCGRPASSSCGLSRSTNTTLRLAIKKISAQCFKRCRVLTNLDLWSSVVNDRRIAPSFKYCGPHGVWQEEQPVFSQATWLRNRRSKIKILPKSNFC